ncbi:MAG: serine/threonine protein kinase [Gloeocapsa sp. DLM2.Bin57]|nr:MAG: serine/threonine protein kinase [Gloeocapsa sp. DLM2.Bin57]
MFKSEQILENRYKIAKQLGRNSGGRQTWFAEDLTKMDFVTVKLLAFNPQMRWEDFKLFEREAKILQQLNHPRIPHYRDYFEIDEQGVTWFAIVQDYIPGFSLQELLAQQVRLTETDIRSLAIAILEILEYLHNLFPQVLHRDIKPSNLIQGPYGQIYLIDFGAVQAQSNQDNSTFTVVGSSGYTPLEQFWGKAVPASDIYALGATLIHLLTGIAPANLPKKNSRIIFADQVNISASLLHWLNKCTAPEVEQRFQNASAALLALTKPLVKHNFTHNQRPAYTRIQLIESSDKLSIFLPAGGYRRLAKIIDPDFWSVEKRIFARIIGELNEVSPISMLIILMSLAIIAYTIGLQLVFFSIITAKLLLIYGERMDLYLDLEKVELIRQSLGLVYGGKRLDLREITDVKLKKRTGIYEIILETETDKFLIGQALREDECLWLINSINDWLELVKTKK